MMGVLSGVSTGPEVDGEDVAIVSLDDIRWRGGENGDDSFVSLGELRGEELADGPRTGEGDSGNRGDPANLLVGTCPPERRRGDMTALGEDGLLGEGAFVGERGFGEGIFGGEGTRLGLCTIGGE